MKSHSSLEQSLTHSRSMTQQFAEIALSSQAKLVEINLDALQELFDIGKNQIESRCADLRLSPESRPWQATVFDQIQKNTALNLELLEVGKQMQDKMTQVIRTSLSNLGQCALPVPFLQTDMTSWVRDITARNVDKVARHSHQQAA